MRLDDLDRDLELLHQASERISANLVELEIDSGRKLLDSSPLAGESAARWTAAGTALTELWRRSGLLERLLGQADEARGARRTDELRRLLRGRSIQLSSAEVPWSERDLLGSSQVTEACTPQALLTEMSAEFDEVKRTITRIGGAWETLIPKLADASRLLAETRELAQRAGDAGRPDLQAASRALAELRARVTADPLAVDGGEVDELLEAAQRISADLEGIAAIQRGFEARILEARELLERLAAAVRDGQSAHRELLVKIAVPLAAPPPEAPDQLDAELREIARLAEQRPWRDTRQALEAWDVRTRTALDEASGALRANRAPLEARNQFRALLEAYQVKAARLGLLEDAEMADLFAQTHDALYTAPTDLAVAAQLLRRYQQAINGSPPTAEARL